MAKTDKSSKKAAPQKVDAIKGKPTVPASSKEILAKTAALAKSTSKANGKKVPPAELSESLESSSSEQSSSEEDDSSEESPPAKSAPAAVKKAVEPSDDDSSDESSSEELASEESDASSKGKVTALEKTTPAAARDDSSDDSEESSNENSDDDEKMASVPLKTSPTKPQKTSDSKDDSSDESNSEESSGGSDSDDDDDDDDEKTSTSAQNASLGANNKRKADSQAAAPPKKVKLANANAEAATSGEETKSIFVGRLSWNVDHDWLAQEFAECGEVESAHVQMDRNTGRSRGFGYVHFKTTDAVEKALALNGKEIDGRAVNIDRSTAPDKRVTTERRAQAFGDTTSPPSAVLFVGNLSFGVNEDMLWETFGEHGDVKSVRVPTDRDTGRPKGFAYVEFSEIGAAKTAFGALQGFELNGRSIRLDYSQPRDSAGGRGGGQGGRGGRGRGGFGGDRGRGTGRGGRGGDRGGRGRGRGGARTGGITNFEGQKITFD